MKKYRVCFRPQNKETEVEEGTTILEAERMAGLEPDAPCGGNGKCGKCRVDVCRGRKTGVVLACQTKVDSDMIVDTLYQEKVEKILAEGLSRKVAVDPGIQPETCPDRHMDTTPFYLMAFDIGTTTVVGYLLDGRTGKTLAVASRMNPQHAFGADVISRANYVLEHGEEGSYALRSVIVNALNALIGEAAAKAGVQTKDILQVSVVGNTCMHHLFLGISPDTLVHAPYVPAVRKGMVLTAEETGLCFGPSVAHIQAPVAAAGAAKNLQESVTAADALVNTMQEHGNGNVKTGTGAASLMQGRRDTYLLPPFELENELSEDKNSVEPDERIVEAGLTQRNTKELWITSRRMRRALKENIHTGVVLLLPNIAGFVGADTVGCMVAAAFDRLDQLTLMVDIGTNGEMVLGDRNRMLTTSTAAGPAFEGAKIECGMRGADGAISHLREEKNDIALEIVGDTRAAGICGSGLIDILAFLIRHGFVNSYGAFRDPEDLEDPLAKKIKNRVISVHDQPAFLLVKGDASATGEDIYLTQKDVREVQLAKGAIAAGIQILTDKLHRKITDIRQVFLAGAFGNYMDSQSACEIGMIPYELHDRIVAVGNAAGEGAKLAAVSREEFRYACRLSRETEFIELAAERDFQDVFVDKLEFDRAVDED
ncbi:MAG: ASKHA domain-containing protein [Bilifractor sp.]